MTVSNGADLIVQGFSKALDIEIKIGEFTEAEKLRDEELLQTKYANEMWLMKR